MSLRPGRIRLRHYLYEFQLWHQMHRRFHLKEKLHQNIFFFFFFWLVDNCEIARKPRGVVLSIVEIGVRNTRLDLGFGLGLDFHVSVCWVNFVPLKANTILIKRNWCFQTQIEINNVVVWVFGRTDHSDASGGFGESHNQISPVLLFLV